MSARAREPLESRGDGVEVVVVTCNSAAVLAGLLESLPAGMEGLDWALTIVDNASTDASAELAASLAPTARILRLDVNRGFAAGVNRGLVAAAPGRDLLVLNPDVRLAGGCAARLRAALGHRPPGDASGAISAGITVPRLLDDAGALLPTLRFEPSVARTLAEAALGVRLSGRAGWGETVLDPAVYARSSIAEWASGAAVMVSGECIERCGGFDESFFLYSEDAEYALRAGALGFATMLVPDAVATHLGGASRTDPALWSLLVCNKVELYRRRHGRGRAFGFRIAAAARELRFALAGNRPSAKAARALLRPGGARRGIGGSRSRLP